jgi:predicted outer membrane repeat protein
LLHDDIADHIQKRRLTMSVSTWLSWRLSGSHARRGQRRNPASRRKKARLFLEHLEGRALLASYAAPTVSALIADINAANTAGGANTITLTAPTTSPYLFTPANNPGNFLPVIAANDNLTIVGNGDTLQPTGRPAHARFFDVSAGASLSLQNLTLQGGEQVGDWSAGGAIYNQGALTLSGVTVQRNEVEPLIGAAMGGGIWSSGSLTLENGTLMQDNTVTGGTRDFNDGLGGAVYIAGGSANISNTTFTGNVATGAGAPGYDNGSGLGGALWVAAYAQVVMTTSTVENNAANIAFNAAGTSYGGGLYVAGGNVTASITLSNDTVESNSASFGGGLYVGGASAGTVTLSNCTVESNSASSAGGGICYIAVYLGGTMTLSNDTVESNSASSGGGLYVNDKMTLSNDTVESNSASSGGGGIYIATAATVYIDPFTVANTINNTASTEPNIDGTYILT